MQVFAFHCPTRINFGEFTAGSAGDLVKEYGGKNPLIITDANLIKAGVVAPVLAGFQESGKQPPIFDQVPAESEVDCVLRALAVATEFGCDSFIGVGGGSVLDTVKAVNVLATFGGEIFDYEGLNSLPGRLSPMVAVPTTAGTGSEVSMAALIRHAEADTKILLGDKRLCFDAAILDPTLLLSLPPALTAATGLDAVTHAIESFTSQASRSPFSDSLCVESLRLMFGHLERATADGANIESRTATLVASTMAGVAFTNTGVGIVHALAHSVGARLSTHHGTTNAIFLPWGMEFNLPRAADRYALLARILGISDSGSREEDALRLIDRVRLLISGCGLPQRLSDLGIEPLSDAAIDEIASQALTDPAIMFNPRESSLEDIMEILKRAY